MELKEYHSSYTSTSSYVYHFYRKLQRAELNNSIDNVHRKHLIIFRFEKTYIQCLFKIVIYLRLDPSPKYSIRYICPF